MPEIQMLDFIQRMRTPWLDHVMVFFTTLGNGGALWIALALILLIRKKNRKTGAFVLAALVTEVILCNGLLKPLVARVRPCEVNTAVEPKTWKVWKGETELKLPNREFELLCFLAENPNIVFFQGSAV